MRKIFLCLRNLTENSLWQKTKCVQLSQVIQKMQISDKYTERMMKQSWEHIDIWWVSLGKGFQKYLVLFLYLIIELETP